MAWPSASVAQTFEAGFVPTDVLAAVVTRPYSIVADTPEGMTAALRAIGLGGSWTRFSSFYEWIYDLEEIPHALLGTPSGRCRFPSFQVYLRLTIEYPRWERPANPDPLLVEAWDAFVELMERDFEERRGDVYAQLTELNRIARRLEVDCPRANSTIDALMDDLAEEQREEAIEAYERGERVALQWPPPGIDRAAQDRYARPDIFRVPSATTVELPPTDPERLLTEAQRDAQSVNTAGLLVVAGHYRSGEIVYFEEAIDAPATAGPIDASVPRPYPGLTELFVATLAGALDSASVLDLGAPIATYLPEIDPVLGQVTLRQLLSHRSGIHNAVPDTANDVDWPDAARTLDARALFTEPGAVYSYSGYDYPLAIQVLESVGGTDFPTLVASALFRPLGMMSTSVGAPVRGVPETSTTPADLMTFLTVWVDGGLRGAPPLTRTASATAAQGLAEGARWFDSGVWHDEVAGVTRVSLMCQSGGFQLFPATETAFMLWTSGRWPNGVWRYLLSEVGEEQGAREEVLAPIGARGQASLGAVDPPCYEPWGMREEVLSLGAPTPAADWAGLYRNGDQINELSDVGGFLKETNGPPLDVSHYRGDVHFVGLNGTAFYPLQLTRDTEGRRYLVLDGRAYIHQDDRPVP
jgi:CubicO group peptidase (beta-lactamase class C family)